MSLCGVSRRPHTRGQGHAVGVVSSARIRGLLKGLGIRGDLHDWQPAHAEHC